MMPVADVTIDNDLMLYKLDVSTSTLNRVSYSSNNPGMYEQLSYNADPGIYYICVMSYACSAPNAFQFVCLSADFGDSYETDDSMALATEQEVGKIVRRTLDNSLDDDCSVFLVPTDGDYHFILQDVPENCNYVLQIFSADQQLLVTVPKNTSIKLVGFIAGGYYLRVSAPDGVVDPAALYTILITPVPALVSDKVLYECKMTSDRTHFVEAMHYPEMLADTVSSERKIYPAQWVNYVDGVRLDVSNLRTEFGRPYYPTSVRHKCGGETSSESSYVFAYKVGGYGSAKAPQVMGSLENALLLSMYNSMYFYYHSIAQPNDIPKVYSDILRGGEVVFIINLDTLKAVDNMKPNWFYGFKDTFPGLGQESASFSSVDGDYIRVP